MAQSTQGWDELGENIRQIIDQAVNQKDYQKLDQTIRQTISKAVDAGSEAVRRASKPNTGPSFGKAAPSHENTPGAQGAITAVELYGRTGKKTAAGILKIIGGGVISMLTFLVLLSAAVMELVFFEGSTLAIPAAVASAGLAGGIWLTGSGVRSLNRISRFKTYCKTLGNKTHCTLQKLAQSVGKSEKYVRREVQKLIGEGLFLQGHLDREQTRLITSHETFRQFEQSRLQLEQRQRLEAEEKARRAARKFSPQVQEVLDRGDAFLEQIRSCNDAIAGQEISAKISRMELIVERIFDRAEQYPQIVPDLKKMMDYYLPMTVKLLNAYADMDAQPIQGENIRASKQEIEKTLDTLNFAFEKLLDSVFDDLTLDVSSDISVLNSMLAQEGLTQPDFQL